MGSEKNWINALAEEESSEDMENLPNCKPQPRVKVHK
jgi:hypothetical protein